MESKVVSDIPQHSKVFPPLFLGLLACWGLINLVQGILTPIGEDEAYYWMYSRYLDWGYFDHPPMIALFIKIGTLLFEKQLGTRFITILAQLATLMVLWVLIREKFPSSKHVILFFGIAASIVMFQVFGFIATPDSPLLLFTTLFLLSYYRFLEKESLWNIFFLSLTMAGLLYSKYHGLLVILFVILSNPGIWIRWKFWLACIFGALIFLPHILWQVHHDFPTLQYHLISRSRNFEFKHVLNYWPNQLVNFNPLFLGFSIFILIKFRPRDLFERALYFIIVGFLLFFFITSVRGHVEPHWTIVSCLAMLILLYRRSVESLAIRKWVYRLLFPFILLLVLLRVNLVFDFLPVSLKFHGQEKWCYSLASMAGDKPVVMSNSYQRPSLYTFYTGKPATTHSGFTYKKNQYDLWNFEQSYQGKEVLLIARQESPSSIPFSFRDGPKEFLYHVDQFFTVQKIRVTFNLLPKANLKLGDTISLQSEVYNPYPFPVDFHDKQFPVGFLTAFYQNGRLKASTPATVSSDLSILQPGERTSVIIRFVVPELIPGKFIFGIVLSAGIIEGSYNSPFIPVNIQSPDPK